MIAGTGFASLSPATSGGLPATIIYQVGYQMKTCTKCHQTKLISEFGKQSGRKDGLRSNCKECCNAATAKWAKENPERCSEKAAKWAKENHKRKTESVAEWAKANKDRRKATNAAHYAANRERYKAIRSAYYEANKQRYKEIGDAWNKENRGARRVHAQNRRTRKLESGGRLTSGLSKKLLQIQRGKCACCGNPLGDDYHLDHIVPLALGGTNTDDNIQLLHARCNKKKGAKHPVDFMQSRGFLL